MKEVTYEDWQKNPTPRMMWVWDSLENAKQQRKVIYISELGISYPIFALTEDKTSTEHFRHCAEIKEPKTRRMTNKELFRWLRGKPHRELKYCSWTGCVYSVLHAYDEDYGDDAVHEDILIREDDGEWKEPLVEVEE